MSIALMTLAWKSDCASGKKMVLLALCDNANDQGECYPSISMLATKCSMSERSVFNHISDLESAGIVRRENRIGRSTIYHIDPCKFCTPANSAPLQQLHPTPANSAPIPLQILHPTPATVAPITIIEPSIEPSSNQIQKPDGVSDGVWQDFKSLRKDKKAKLTKTALTAIVSEAAKAGWTVEAALSESCARGWTAFKASWVADKQNKGGAFAPSNKQAALEAQNRQVGEQWAAKREHSHEAV